MPILLSQPAGVTQVQSFPPSEVFRTAFTLSAHPCDESSMRKESRDACPAQSGPLTPGVPLTTGVEPTVAVLAGVVAGVGVFPPCPPVFTPPVLPLGIVVDPHATSRQTSRNSISIFSRCTGR